MKVEIEKGVWLASGDGDPSRTLKKENAKEFKKVSEAYEAMVKARTYRPFQNAKIIL